MTELEETKAFLQRRCIANCGHNANESCICKIAQCFKEIEKAEQALIKTQNLERFTKLVIEKNVEIQLLKENETAEDYNLHFIIDDYQELTQEEFDFIKEIIKKYEKSI